MIFNDIICGTVDSSLLSINHNEIIARIGQKIDGESLEFHLNKINSVAVYRYAYVRTDLTVANNVCDFGFAKVYSEALAKVFEGCNEAFLMVVSAGTEVDRLISRLYVQNPADAFIVDGIVSAMIESCADYVNTMICKNANTTKRFSPGYADFPLEFQRSFLDRLNAYRSAGITLNENSLMIPMKSITAVIGIK